MLDMSTNDLGHCFISLWSKYLLDGNYEAIRNQIVKLAELGEVQAIQAYYLYEEKPNNRKIANNISEKYDDFLKKSHKWAFAKYCYLKSLISVEEMVEEIEKRKRFFGRASIDNNTFFKYFEYAVTPKPGLYYFTYLSFLPKEFLKYTDKDYDIHSEKNIEYLKEMRKLAYYVYKEYPNDKIRFSVARHLFMFGTCQKDKRFARKLLEELANRDINIDKIIKNKRR